MKIRLNSDYVVEAMPGSLKFKTQVNARTNYFDTLEGAVKAVAMDIINQTKDELTVTEYKELFKHTYDELMNGVIEYD